MATFNDVSLPIELVDSILELLTTKSDLASLCLVSKDLRYLVAPRLYHSVAIDCGKGGRPASNARNTAVWDFLCSLMRNMELARYIKKARFSHHGNYWDKEDKDPAPDLCDEDHWGMQLLVDRVNPSDPEAWIRAIEAGEPEVLVALALYHLPSLEVFEVSINSCTGTSFICSLFDLARQSEASNSTPLSALLGIREVRYDTKCMAFTSSPEDFFLRNPIQDIDSLLSAPHLRNPEDIFCSIQDICSLLGAPHIRTLDIRLGELTGWNSGRRSRNFHWPSPNCCFTNITTLVLRNSHLISTSMREFLSAMPNIVDFDYQFCGIDDDTLRYDWMIPLRDPNFGQGLEPLRQQLQTLRISIEIIILGDAGLYSKDPSNAIHTETCLSVLRQFKVLKTLEIPLIVLLGWFPRAEYTLLRVLPSNLEYLNITDTMGGLVEYKWSGEDVMLRLQEYLTSGRATLMKRIEVGPHSACDSRWRVDIFDPIRQLCREMGIEFIYRSLTDHL